MPITSDVDIITVIIMNTFDISNKKKLRGYKIKHFFTIITNFSNTKKSLALLYIL